MRYEIRDGAGIVGEAEADTVNGLELRERGLSDRVHSCSADGGEVRLPTEVVEALLGIQS